MSAGKTFNLSVPYRESWGEDYYDDENPPPDVLSRWDYLSEDDDDLPADWHYGAPGEELARYRSKHGMKYDWETHLWHCSCSSFVHTGRCKHAYRFRNQVTVVVNRKYL